MKVFALVALSVSLVIAAPSVESDVYYRPNPEHVVYDLPAPSPEERTRAFTFDQQLAIGLEFAAQTLGVNTAEIQTTDRYLIFH
jgi:hypothetical protein